jgi:hypothetical protein
MQNTLFFKLVPAILFVLCGIAFADAVVVTSSKCTYTGSCTTAPPNHSCVDIQGDGFCDYTSIPWVPVDPR